MRAIIEQWGVGSIAILGNVFLDGVIYGMGNEVAVISM